VDVYAVEQRTADAPDVSLDLQRRAAALSGRVIPEAAGLWIISLQPSGCFCRLI
jgi:hypothetical protein